jgi:NADPH:quinone reductase-like Zn-dependent oxidoreductase
MRAVELKDGFGIDSLTLVQRAVPEPGPGEIGLKMLAASLNYRDLLMVRGQYNPRQPLPLIPCSDGVGRVISVGEGVDPGWLNRRVCPIFAQTWLSGSFQGEALKSTLGGPLDGTLCEVMTVPVESVVEIPDDLDDTQAACLPCAGVTAFRALGELGAVKAGERVLLQGTGGVSLAALGIAKALGATVAITSSRDERLERAKSLGADAGFNYVRDPKWARTARAWTGGEGFHHVVEVGGAETLESSLRAVAPGGSVYVIGVLSGVQASLTLTRLLMHQVRMQGVFVGSKSTFLGLLELMKNHPCRPVVDEVFSLADIRAAFEHLAAGRHFGKVVIRLT